jgi:mono/diheme cytochrome c family protein
MTTPQRIAATPRRKLWTSALAMTAAATVAASLHSSVAQAGEPLPTQALTPNTQRGNTAVLSAGQTAFNQGCARCHGVDAEATPDAPDLRRLNGFCRRLKSLALQQACTTDVDTYFMTSVLEGKVRAGLVHMPPWKGLLSDDTIWAIRTYLESRRPPPAAQAPALP